MPSKLPSLPTLGLIVGGAVVAAALATSFDEKEGVPQDLILLNAGQPSESLPNATQSSELLRQSDATMKAFHEALGAKLNQVDPRLAATLAEPFEFYEFNKTENPDRSELGLVKQVEKQGSGRWGQTPNLNFFWIQSIEEDSDGVVKAAFSSLKRVLLLPADCSPQDVECQLTQYHEVTHAMQDTQVRHTLTGEALNNYFSWHVDTGDGKKVDLDKELMANAYEIEALNALLDGDLKSFYRTGVPVLDVDTIQRRLAIPYSSRESLELNFVLAESYFKGGGGLERGSSRKLLQWPMGLR